MKNGGTKMRLAATLVVTVCLVASQASAEDSSEKLTFRKAGFSIAPLDGQPKGPTPVFTMYLPTIGGFTPNVNVQIQPYTDGIDAYAALSRAQFKDAGLEVRWEKKKDKSTVTFEYSGSFDGNLMHWYAKAVQHDKNIYLTTATATAEQWDKVATKLKACVDSFETAESEPAHAGDRKPHAR
jgi:hypothetical protein